MATVTVSRQYGAGGLRVARALAESLGFTLVDRELAEQAALRLGLDPAMAEGRDERAPDIVEEIGLALASGTPGFGGGLGMPLPELDDRALAEATGRVIGSLGDAGGYVILGRGAQAVLAGREDARHICLVGDLADRAARIAAWQGCKLREARSRCERFDAERAGYLKHFYGRDIRDPLLYDAVLNTSRLPLDAAVAVAMAVVTAGRIPDRPAGGDDPTP